jgi:3-hydroxyacyl-CoA dehydrogenase/enoyl-CoA hydratase/3-hydroxybutyryl-CoA epimerase
MAITYEKDSDGIVLLTLDMPDHSANVLNDVFFEAFSKTLDKLEADESATGAILISGKKLWIAGADIDRSFNSQDPAHFFEMSEQLKADLRRLETIGKPVVAALNGTALGGGLEVALSCHYRVAIDNDRIKFGFPEVGLGLLPGAGGVVRTVRLIGLQNAMEWLSQNKKYTPKKAIKGGMIHALATDQKDLLAQSKAWIKANPEGRAPWDADERYKIPGGNPSAPRIAQMLAVAPAMIRKETKGIYPAPAAIMAAAVEGAQVDFATACRIESRYFAQLGSGQISRNMISAFWTQLNQIKKGQSRPKDIAPQSSKKVGVLGSGLMGHGIAYVTAAAGMEVVMTDKDQQSADKGKERIGAILTKQVERGRMAQEKSEQILGNINATPEYDNLAGCDLIIEAVFENRALKASVTKAAEVAMEQSGVFASNTSTLPITGLAEASSRPQKFIGLHFFSPVDKMQLVEIIVGEKTDDETLAKAFDYVLAIGKVPIVVNDSRGFYTSRVFSTWSNEGMKMLLEGQHPHAIEMAGLQAGMPVGPLAVMDEVSLGLADHIRKQTIEDFQASGQPDTALAAAQRGDHSAPVIDKMLSLKRPGRAGGGGFYEYSEKGKTLWPELTSIFMNGQPQLPQQEMIDRIIYIQAVETARCMEEGILRNTADANLGAIFGWGFAPQHGGPLQFINGCGLQNFLDRANELAAAYGERFVPPQLLVDMAARDETF